MESNTAILKNILTNFVPWSLFLNAPVAIVTRKTNVYSRISKNIVFSILCIDRCPVLSNTVITLVLSGTIKFQRRNLSNNITPSPLDLCTIKYMINDLVCLQSTKLIHVSLTAFELGNILPYKDKVSLKEQDL